MTSGLDRLCARSGIETRFVGVDGVERRVPATTLEALVEALGVPGEHGTGPAGIAEVRRELAPPTCWVPPWLEAGRGWGLTCQVPGLRSARNLGIGDLADLGDLCRIAADAGADFLGVNPLHALYWGAPDRNSPFSPSNRRFLNPLLLAVDWIEGFERLNREEAGLADRARAGDLLDPVAAHAVKDRVLRRLNAAFPWSERLQRDWSVFLRDGGPALRAHALFEAVSCTMSRQGQAALPSGWPDGLRTRASADVDAFADRYRDEVDFHLWLQWQTHRQLRRVQDEACAAGMRLGLYLDCAVGAAPDGSAAWSEPEITVPGLSIGAPPDAFSLHGQDWGLSPLSPTRLPALDARPLTDMLSTTMASAGAVRIDHVMSLARLWLIPRGAGATEGAYVRYPLGLLLRRLAETSREHRALVIGEDLGVVPEGFRELMRERALHGYRIFFFERTGDGFSDPRLWPADTLACAGTHDTHTVAGWWHRHDLDVRRSVGHLSSGDHAVALDERRIDRDAVRHQFGLAANASARDVSVALHARIAGSPSRLMALQIEDALGLVDQVNVPGTVSEHPNWRRRLPVDVDAIAGHPGFGAHVRAIAGARP